jgi:hypothetical protein
MIDKDRFKEWDKIIIKNKEEWAKDLYELILKEQCWDVSFDRYAKYRIFIVHFETQINDVFKQARDSFPELDMTFEDIAHDLFLAITDDGSMQEELDKITKQIKNMLPKA